jgi:coiled-coil domain-containing protein 130
VTIGLDSDGHARKVGFAEPAKALAHISSGFNKYYPPDYDGEKHKSLNAYRGWRSASCQSPGLTSFAGKHALGDRARKIDKGILITRFELPFNIWW